MWVPDHRSQEMPYPLELELKAAVSCLMLEIQTLGVCAPPLSHLSSPVQMSVTSGQIALRGTECTEGPFVLLLKYEQRGCVPSTPAAC